MRSPLLRAEVTLLAAAAASATVSVFAAQVGLALVACVHIARTIKRETRGFALPVDAAVGAFTIWTFMSAAFAPSPIAAHESAKKIVLFLFLYLAAEALRTDECRAAVLDAILIGGLALATLAVLQYAFLGYDTMDLRPRSFLGHYMTAAGVIMIAVLVAVEHLLAMEAPPRPTTGSLGVCALVVGFAFAVAVAYRIDLLPTEVERVAILAVALVAGRRAFRGQSWPDHAFADTLASLVAPLGTLALLLSRTRSAWLGLVMGLAVLAWMKKPRLLLVLPAAIGAVLLFSPRTIVDRLTITDASSRDRYYMWQAGLDMIMDKPIFGQGTGMILEVYPKFRWEGAPNPNAPHLHNNFIQIAAERGLPCLVFLGWLLYLLGREAWRARRHSRAGPLVLAVLAGTLTSGLFEYTLGDSEILMLILLLSALPFSVRPDPASPGSAVASHDQAELLASSGSELVFEQ